MNTLMIRYKKIIYATLIALISFSVVSCLDDLDTEPKGPNINVDPYDDPDNYPLLLAKIYAGFSKIGITGPSDDGDIPSSSDQGKTNFLRIYFNMQELTSDEAKCAWNDADERNYSQSILLPDNYIGYMFYQRCQLNVVFANEFLRNTEVPRVEVANLDRMRAEVRVLRAMNYYFMLDLVGNPGWITEEHPLDGSYLPRQLGRTGMFEWIESELLEVERSGLLLDHSYNTYGLITNQVVHTVLAKLYLNAEVYTGTARWQDALTYARKVTSYSGLVLEDTYQNLFCADNNRSQEIIFALPYDNIQAQDWGGLKAIMAASTDGDMTGTLLDFAASWSGYRATQQLTRLFDGNDNRALFFTEGRTQEMTELNDFTKGWSVIKFTNKSWDGADNPRGVNEWPDTDFPMFRLADVILMQAEAEYRTGNGNAVNTFNQVYAHPRTGLAPKASITEQDILDERGRELYWEAHRRTDLIRFNKFTRGYNWAWKGGVENGQDMDDRYRVFPFSTLHLQANTELQQNPGYTASDE